MTKTFERENQPDGATQTSTTFVIREEVENLLDYLAVLEASAKDAGKPRLSHDEAKKRYS